jgi:hypothetical protein
MGASIAGNVDMVRIATQLRLEKRSGQCLGMPVHKRDSLMLYVGRDLPGAHRDLQQLKRRGRRPNEATADKLGNVG